MLPSVSLDPHYLLLGTTQSGKTLCIRMLLQQALLPFDTCKNRAVIYDGKREYYPLLRGMGIPADRILILNPADERCVAWDLAKDVRSRDDAANLIAILIPDERSANENPFFVKALRSLLTEVVMAFQALTPGKWRLIDLLNAVRTPSMLKRILRTTREGKETLARYFTDAKETVGGIISTIDARFISEYETIARVWARCDRSVALTEWVTSQSILLLGFDANRQSVDRLNQAIFQRASQLICSLPEAGPDNPEHTWAVLDEVRFTGKLPMLSELISFGRTKNAHVILAPQDLDGLIDVYGEHRANEMLGLCGNVSILRLTSPKTRDWAAKFFGDYEAWETDTSHSVTTGRSSTSGSGGSSSTSRSRSETHGTSTRKVKRESVLASEFFNLPSTNRDNGMHGFFATPGMGCWRGAIPTAFLDRHLPPSDPEARSFIPRPSFATDPVRWTKEQEQEFTEIKPLDHVEAEENQDKERNGPPPANRRTTKESTKTGPEPLPGW